VERRVYPRTVVSVSYLFENQTKYKADLIIIIIIKSSTTCSRHEKAEKLLI
jgi:hypothetical protein